MVSLARSGLLCDWRRFVAAVLALAFSTLLIHAQIGVTLGWFLNMASLLETSSADLWVSRSDVKSYEQAGGLPKASEMYVRACPEIVSVEPQSYCWGELKADLAGKVFCQIFGVDRDKSSSMFLPKEFIGSFGEALDEPMTVALESSSQAKFGLKAGDFVEINRKRVKIIGFSDAFKSARWHGMDCLQGAASLTTLQLLSSSSSCMFLLAKLKDPAKAELVKAQLNEANKGKLKAWTKNELFWDSQKYWLFESPKNSQIIFSALLSALIGVVITNQSLRSAILASLRDYAAIRALGVSRFELAKVVLEQALWVGALGLGLGLLMTEGLSLAAQRMGIIFKTPFWLPFATGPFILLTALVSGLLALRVLYKTQPAELLR